MQIQIRLTSDMKSAMREKDQVKLDTIRFVMAAIKYREIELRPEAITEDEVISVLKKLAKQRKESIEQYQAGGRQDLVDKETAELKILELYLPAQMSREQLEKIISEVMSEVKATSVKDMGTVMKAVMAKTAGSADNKMVSEIIRSKLS